MAASLTSDRTVGQRLRWSATRRLSVSSGHLACPGRCPASHTRVIPCGRCGPGKRSRQGGPRVERRKMEYRELGRSGLRVSVLTMGTMTFGGTGPFANVGNTEVDEARRQVDQCLEAGVNMIDTADVYSGGRSEEIVGEVLRGRR